MEGIDLSGSFNLKDGDKHFEAPPEVWVEIGDWRLDVHSSYPVDLRAARVVGCRVLPWFLNNRFPLYLAPMAGVTDVIFRQICKELGADVMVTEFISAEGIMQADAALGDG